jgi:hemolysin activation/secretion protein
MLRFFPSTVFLLFVAPVALAAQPDSTADNSEPRFAVAEFRVLGNSLLQPVDIERAIYRHTGPDRSMLDVESARADLETAYRAAGYGTVFVDIPEQDVHDGVVRLRVTEGRVDRVRITGTRYFSNRRILAQLPALQSGEAPNLPAVQDQLAALNRQTADRVVVPVLKSGGRPGTVDVELRVSDQLPLHGSLEVNDRYTADTSKLRVNASVGYHNLFQRNDSISLQYQFAPENPGEVQAYIGSYVFRSTALPAMTFALYGVDSSTDVAALGTLSVIGNGQIFGARAIRQLPDLRGWTQGATFGLDYKDFLENIVLSPETSLQTPISYINWSAAWSAGLRRERSLLALTATANIGIRGLGNAPAEFSDKRFRGVANYFYLRTNAQYQWSFHRAWSLMGRGALQVASDPLVSNEQFGIGGADTVRGYLESSLLGDHGASGTVELRYSGLAPRLGLSPQQFHLFGFIDAGVVSLLYPLPQQDEVSSLVGAGLGLRLQGWHGLDMTLDAARALDDAGKVKAGDFRTHFNFRYSF